MAAAIRGCATHEQKLEDLVAALMRGGGVRDSTCSNRTGAANASGSRIRPHAFTTARRAQVQLSVRTPEVRANIDYELVDKSIDFMRRQKAFLPLPAVLNGAHTEPAV
jgi:hypothetical protein